MEGKGFFNYRRLGVITLLLLMAGLFSPNYAQESREVIYEAYITGKMEDWKLEMDRTRDAWKRDRNKTDLYALVEMEYGYIAWLISVERKPEARELVKRAEGHIEKLLEMDPEWARVLAFRGAIYGFKVGLNPYKAVVWGKRSFDSNKEAFALAPEDPQVWMEKANIELYKPSVFGSNAPEAAEMYAKAVRLYEAEPEGVEKNWLYLNALNGLATAQVEAGDTDRANQTYKKLIKHEPRFKWLVEEVYPDFQKKYGY